MELNAGVSTINSLWIGAELSVLELLTLRSFVYHGHKFQMWVYEPLKTVIPAGVLLRDANEILPASQIFQRSADIPGLTSGSGSLAPFSDLFRFKLLHEVGGWWVDMDITCLRPLWFNSEYVFRTHHELEIMGNIMKCPRGSELMRYAYSESREKVNMHTADWLAAQRILAQKVREEGLLIHRRNLCNLDVWEEVVTYIYDNQDLKPDWHVFHWCNEMWRGGGINKNVLTTGSTYARLATFFGLS